MPGGVIGQSGSNVTTPQTGAHGYTLDGLYTLALDAGLTPDNAKKAAAVAWAETKGNPNAHNTTPPDDSWGLWQINLYGNLASRVHTLGLKAPSDLLNPVTNAKAMAVISAHGTNFGPWSTYGGADYQAALGHSFQRVDHNTGVVGAVVDVVGGAVSAVTAPAQAAVQAVEILGKTAVWVSKASNWVRVGYVLGGAVVLVVGVAYIVGGTKAGKATVQGGLAVATDGASVVASKTASAVKGKKPAKTEEKP